MTEPTASHGKNEDKFIPVRDAADLVSYTGDYISKLAREGKVDGERRGRNWFVDPESLKLFSLKAEADKRKRSELIAAQRRVERKEKKVINAPVAPVAPLVVQNPNSKASASLAFAESFAITVCVVLVFLLVEAVSTSGIYPAEMAKGVKNLKQEVASSVGLNELVNFPTLAEVSEPQTQQAAIAVASVEFFGDLWCGTKRFFNFAQRCSYDAPVIEYAVDVVRRPLVSVEPKSEGEQQVSLSNSSAGNSSQIINQYITNPTTIIREAGEDTVSESERTIIKEITQIQGRGTGESISSLQNSLSQSVTTESLTLSGKFNDSTNSPGVNGYVLQSTGVATQWVATSSLGISGGSSTPSAGSVSSTTLAISNWTNGYVLQASTTASGGFDWVATSTLGISGSGTVTSVGASVPTGWTISNSPVTTTGTLAFDYDTGYAAVLTASTTNWNNFYDTPSTRITAGNGLTWSSNTLNFDGGDSPGGVLGGTWASPTLDDSAVSSSTLASNNWTNGYILQASTTASGGFDWVATSTLGISGGSGATTFLALTDTPSAYTANRILYTTGSAVASSSALTFDGTTFTTNYATTTGLSATNLNVSNSVTFSSLANGGFLTTDSNGLLSTSTIDISNDTNLSISATGLELSGDAIALSAGYNIPLTASTTNWNNFYNTPSTRITAGTGLSWSTNTLNAEVQSSDLANYLTIAAWNATTTDALDEGSNNLYFTNSRADARISATTTLPNLTTLANLTTVGTIGTGVWQGTAITDTYVADTLTIGSGSTIADGLIVEADLNLNAPTDNYLLVASSSAAGGFEWVATSTSRLGFTEGTVTSVAATVPTGWTIGGSPITDSGTLAFDYDTGYAAVLTASTTNWNNFYDTPSSRITAADNLAWTGNSLGVASGYVIPLTASTTEWDAAYASTTALSNSYIRSLFSNSATGLTYNSSTGATSLTAGYNIPLTASTTNWNNFYDTPSTRITAGDALTWTSNTLDVNDVTAAMLASADFGDFSCNGTTCSFDNDTVGTAEIADGDFGAFTFSSGSATLDSSTVSSSTLASSNWTNGYILQASTTASGGFDWVATSTLGLASTYLQLTDTPSSFTANRIPFTNSGATALTDTANFVFDGTNLGVGTTSPSHKLVVSGTNTGGPGSSAQLVVGDGGGNSDGKQLQIGYNTSDDYGFIQPVHWGDNYKNLILNQNGGNVGIGTTSPSSKLFVATDDGSGPITLLNLDNASSVAGSGSQLAFSVGGVSVGYFENVRDSIGAYSMRFGTWNNSAGDVVERMRIDNAGNIGIGTTSPVAKLSVAGNTYLGGNLTATGTVTFSALTGGLLTADSNGLLSTTSVSASDLSLTNGYVFRGSSSNVAEATSSLFIADNGRVGIGTTNPTGTFEVYNSATDSLVYTTSGNLEVNAPEATSNKVRLGSVDNTYTGLYVEAGSTYVISDSDQQVRIGNRGVNASTLTVGSGNVLISDTAGSEYVRFQGSTGNVGIGTTSPVSKLSVAGSTHLGGNVTATGTLSVTATTTLSSDLVVDTSTLYVNASTDRVGIGTTDPSQLLDVNGTALFNTALFGTSADHRGLLTSGSGEFRVYGGAGEVLQLSSNNNTSQGITIDLSGNVGIGTTSPSDELEINSSRPTIRLTDNDGPDYAAIDYNFGGLEIHSDRGNFRSNSFINFYIDNSELARLTNDGNFGIGTTSPSSKLSVAGNTYLGGNLTATGTVTFSALTGGFLKTDGSGVVSTSTVNLASASDVTGVLDETNGGTGLSSFSTGDILYASGANTLARLAAGSDGQVLKLTSGLPSWGADNSGGGGGSGLWASTTNNRIIYPADTSDIVVIGTSATTTTGTIFEVLNGNTYFEDNVSIGTATSSARLHVSNGDVLFDRGNNTTSYGTTLTIGGARNASGSNFGALDFQNYDSNDSASDLRSCSYFITQPQRFRQRQPALLHRFRHNFSCARAHH